MQDTSGIKLLELFAISARFPTLILFFFQGKRRHADEGKFAVATIARDETGIERRLHGAYGHAAKSRASDDVSIRAKFEQLRRAGSTNASSVAWWNILTIGKSTQLGLL